MRVYSQLLIQIWVFSWVVGILESSSIDVDTKFCFDDACNDIEAAPQKEDVSQPDTACTDNHEYCSFWAGLEPSECTQNPNYMRNNCKKSCGLCVNGTIASEEMSFDLGEEQNIVGNRAQEIQTVVDETVEYMKNVVMVDPKYDKVRHGCKNLHKDCSFWKLTGECHDKPGYMHVNCAPACQTCEMLQYENRCPMQAPLNNAWGPGDLDEMFERIIADDDLRDYEVTVLSSPHDADGGPWMVMFDNFATPEECKRLIELGGIEGYKRSADVGEERFDGSYTNKINNGRTSTNAWCQHECYEDPLAKKVIERIAKVTNIPEENSEYLQLLKYEESQFYQVHSDYIPHETKRQQGNRLLTLYIYLSDVEAGGGTNFPALNKTVIPKQGRAVLWPSVLNEDPSKKDERTIHTALPVIKGRKYGANAWIHLRDFKTPNKIGCQ